MAAELRHRRGGLNATGSNMDTGNQRLMDAMGDVKAVADLQGIRDSTHGTVDAAVGATIASCPVVLCLRPAMLLGIVCWRHTPCCASLAAHHSPTSSFSSCCGIAVIR